MTGLIVTRSRILVWVHACLNHGNALAMSQHPPSDVGGCSADRTDRDKAPQVNLAQGRKPRAAAFLGKQKHSEILQGQKGLNSLESNSSGLDRSWFLCIRVTLEPRGRKPAVQGFFREIGTKMPGGCRCSPSTVATAAAATRAAASKTATDLSRPASAPATASIPISYRSRRRNTSSAALRNAA